MADTLTETDTYPATVQGPSSNETGSSSDMRGFLTSLANRTKYLKVVVDKFRDGGTVALGGALTLSGFGVTLTHALTGLSATLSGALSAASATFTGNVTVNGILPKYGVFVQLGADAATTVTTVYPSGTRIIVPSLTSSQAYNFVKADSTLGDHYWLIIDANSNAVAIEVDGASVFTPGANTTTYCVYNGATWTFASWATTTISA